MNMKYMNRKIAIAASVLAVVALSGCAPAQLSSFLPSGFNGNQQQTPDRVMPGTVVSVSPVGQVGGGFFSGTKPGEDVIVKTDTNPPQMLSIIQPLESGSPAFTQGEQVGVVYRSNGNGTRVIPLPNSINRFPVKTAEQSKLPPLSQTHLSLNPPAN